VSELKNPLLSPSPEAWDRLIEAVEPASLLVVIEQRMSALLRRTQTAEDIFQDALLQAWRDRHRFEWRGVKSFRSWLLAIIDHRIYDAVDRQVAAKRAGTVPVASLPAFDGTTTCAEPGFPSGSTTPSRLAIYREQADVMGRALAGLPDDQREVVRLRLFEEASLEEIAARLGLGLSAVRHRFRKGSELYAKRLERALGSNAGADEARAPDGPPGPASHPAQPES
jgi:RNA polymerase sigma-70 factor (ECF subfamily)